MEKYKSWSDLQKLLNDRLCLQLRGRVTYFLTRYHDVHNAYGRAAIRVDGKELVCFSWIEQCRQENDIAEALREHPERKYEKLRVDLKPEWDAACQYCEMDFLEAVLQYRSMSVQDALRSENLIVRVLAILDRRTGRRTLERMEEAQELASSPDWVRQFLDLRLSAMRKQKQTRS